MVNKSSYYENSVLWQPENYQHGPEAKRVRTTLQWIPTDVSSVLDIGCGNGVITNQLNETKLAIGADRSAVALKWVLAPSLQSDIAHIPFNDNSFDMVITSEVIEHLPLSIYKQSLRELARITRKYILISVPYQEELVSRQVICPICKTQFHKYLHMRSFDLLALERLFENEPNLRLIKAEGLVPEKFFRLSREIVMIRNAYFSNISPFSASLVCPHCGYIKPQTIKPEVQQQSHLYPIAQKIKSLVKTIWPKKIKQMWWLALYAKTGQFD